MRLDLFLAMRGFYKSRSKASAAIKSGSVNVNGKVIKTPAFDVDENDVIIASDNERFVSRAGEKLEYALNEFGIDPKGATVLDIGASTGGFTDCLLMHGASYVYALDVGSGQLDGKLRGDERVCVLENFNARNAKKSDFDKEIDMITMDVSFISQTLIYPACSDILKSGGKMITLVKPQFEAGKEFIGKGGIVHDKDGKIIENIIKKIDIEANNYGFSRVSLTRSPITGGDGNTEYLALFIKEGL